VFAGYQLDIPHRIPHQALTGLPRQRPT